MPSPSASAAASSASALHPVSRHGYAGQQPGWIKLWTTFTPQPSATGRTVHPEAGWLKELDRYPHSVEIPLSRDAHNPVENGECVGSYQIFRAPTVAARATIVAMRFCTGILLR
jgi:hypothetical protein